MTTYLPQSFKINIIKLKYIQCIENLSIQKNIRTFDADKNLKTLKYMDRAKQKIQIKLLDKLEKDGKIPACQSYM